jgi:hypothetical protein
MLLTLSILRLLLANVDSKKSGPSILRTDSPLYNVMTCS